MFSKLKKNRSEGFTIIEVMIVLAIAALILLIVLLAVPALQRGSRNTQRKNDVSAVSAAVANYITDNNGAIPDRIVLNAAATQATIDCHTGNVNGTHCDTTNTNTQTAKIGFFTTIQVNTSPSAATHAPNPETLVFVPGWSCNDAGTGLNATNPRTAAFLYQNESGGTSNQCTEQ